MKMESQRESVGALLSLLALTDSLMISKERLVSPNLSKRSLMASRSKDGDTSSPPTKLSSPIPQRFLQLLLDVEGDLNGARASLPI
jgi:hypothetical protein